MFARRALVSDPMSFLKDQGTAGWGPRAIAVLSTILMLTSCASRADAPTREQLRADALFAGGQYAEALEVYRSLSYDDEALAYRALIGAALCHARLGEAERFEAYALEASATAPVDAMAHGRLGRMYVAGAERFRTHPAGPRYARIGVEYLRRVFFADNDQTHVAHNLGLGLYLLDDFDASTVILEEALRQNPDRVDTMHLLLNVHRQLGRSSRVLALLEGRDVLTPLMKSMKEWAEGEASRSDVEVEVAVP